MLVYQRVLLILSDFEDSNFGTISCTGFQWCVAAVERMLEDALARNTFEIEGHWNNSP